MGELCFKEAENAVEERLERYSSSLTSFAMSLLDILIVILLVSWLGGFSLHIAGGFIHLLLVVVLIVVVLRLFGVGRRV